MLCIQPPQPRDTVVNAYNLQFPGIFRFDTHRDIFEELILKQ